jgi:transcriptional regulator with AAA-type ATPase domain
MKSELKKLVQEEVRKALNERDTPYGIDVWTDEELGVEELFEEMKARLQKLQEETTEPAWRKALKQSEMDLEKWADKLGMYSRKLGMVGVDNTPTISF